MSEAAALGILQVHFSGGEPLARRDLPELVRHAAELQLYTNLITSGVLLTDKALAALREAKVDHIQLSFQDSRAEDADHIGGYRGGHQKKRAAAQRITAAGLPLTLNFVIHRLNVDRVADMIAMSESLGASRIEIAHAQYYGWALRNRDAAAADAGATGSGHSGGGGGASAPQGQDHPGLRGARLLRLSPKGLHGRLGPALHQYLALGKGAALPCRRNSTLYGISIGADAVLGRNLDPSAAFQKFRGTDWMPEPCRSCDQREIDWGGCRCQA